MAAKFQKEEVRPSGDGGGKVRNVLSEMDRRYEALVEGADPADMVQDDGVWRSGPDRDRAADLDTFADHVRLLATGGQLEDPADDLSS